MSEYTERRAGILKEQRQRARKRRWENRLVALLVTVGGLGALLGLMFALALLGAIGILLGWNLGVSGLAHAVHTDVRHIGFWTAFGASFAIGVIRRLFSGEGVKLQAKT